MLFIFLVGDYNYCFENNFSCLLTRIDEREKIQWGKKAKKPKVFRIFQNKNERKTNKKKLNKQ